MTKLTTLDYTTFGFPSDWKPIGHDNTTPVPLKMTGVPDEAFGISGPGGTLFALMWVPSIPPDTPDS